MENSNIALQDQIAALRQEIIAYKPGKAVPSDDKRVASLYPDKLVIYLIDVTGYVSGILPDYLQCVLRGDSDLGEADESETTSRSVDFEHFEEREIRVTDYISFNSHCHVPGEDIPRSKVQQLSEKVGCFLVAIGESGSSLAQYLESDWITPIHEITGRPPIFLILCDLGNTSVDTTRGELKENHGITDIFNLPYPETLSPQEQLEILRMLRRCLVDGDERTSAKFGRRLGELRKVTSWRKIYDHAVNSEKSAKVKQQETEATLQSRIEELERRHEDKMRSRDEDISHLTDIIHKTLEDVQKGEAAIRRVKQFEKEKEEEQERFEEEKQSIEAKWKLEVDSKKQRIATLTEIVHEKGRVERAARMELEKLKGDFEEETMRYESDKTSLKTELSKAILEKESLDQLNETLTNILHGNEETIKKMQHEKDQMLREKQSLQRRLKKQQKRAEQLDREILKLRVKIQVESELRSKETKKDTGEPATDPAQSQDSVNEGDSLPQDSAEEVATGSEFSQQQGSPLPNDEFADVLKKIAEDLADEREIYSLGGQLGFVHGQIKRALQTNMRFYNVTSEGTHHMLKLWRSGVSREDERSELRRALEGAKLVSIADQYLPQAQEVDDCLDIVADYQTSIESFGGRNFSRPPSRKENRQDPGDAKEVHDSVKTRSHSTELRDSVDGTDVADIKVRQEPSISQQTTPQKMSERITRRLSRQKDEKAENRRDSDAVEPSCICCCYL